MPDVQPHSSNIPSKPVSSGRRSTTQNETDEQALLNIATEAFVKELGLDDDSLLKGGHVQIREVPAGTYLVKEESDKVRDVNNPFLH